MIIQHYIELLRYHRMQLVALVIFTTLAFAVISTIKLLNSPVYTASAAVTIVPTEAEMAFSSALGANRREAGRALTHTYIEYVKSRPVILAAIEKIAVSEKEVEAILDESSWGGYIAKIKEFKTTIRRWMHILNYGSYIEIPKEEGIVNKIRDAINVKNITNTHILKIEVNLPEPQMAANLANTLAEVFVDQISNDLNEDANKLEKHIQDRIDSLESELSAIQSKRTRQKKRFGIIDDDTSYLSQIDILRRQLAELNSRLLSIKLSRTASTKMHIIEPAVVPNYPSSPQVLRNTILGFLTGIILGLVIIIIRDTTNNKIVTSSDLEKIVGVRGIGILKKKWVRKRKWHPLLKLGIALERRLAIHGDFDKCVDSDAEFIPSHKTQLITHQEHVSATSGNIELQNQIKIIKPEIDRNEMPLLQVTGMTDIFNVCWATVGLAAAFATQGRKVICKLPADFIQKQKNFNQLEKWKTGSVKYTDGSEVDEMLDNDLTVECMGPMMADLGLTQTMNTCSTLVCVLPIDKIQEDMVEALLNRTLKNNHSNISYLIMA